MQATTLYHRLAAVALVLIIALGVYGLIARPLLAKYHFYQDNLENLQARLQRLEGMLATRQALEAQLQRIRRDKSANVFYLNQPSPTLAATDLQQRVKTVVEVNSAGRLVSTQILPVAQEAAFSRVGIKVQMTGDTQVLQKVIHTLEANRPLLFIDNLQIRSRTIRERGRGNQADTTSVQLTIQFDLAGYLRRSEG